MRKELLVKTASLLMTAALAGMLLAGCGGKKDTAQNQAVTAIPAAEASSEAPAEASEEAPKAPFFEKGVYANYAEGLEEPDKNYFYIFNSEVHGFTADGDHDGIGVPFEVEQTDGKAAFHIGGAEEDPDVFIVTSAGDGMIHGYFEDTPDRPLVFEYLAEANPDTFMIEHFPDAPEEGE